jgi:hypothetical protein
MALADVAIRLAANSATTAIEVLFDIFCPSVLYDTTPTPVPMFLPSGRADQNMPASQLMCGLPPAAVVIVIMSCAGMILLEFFVRVPQGSMVGAVLPAAGEALIVSAFVLSADLPVFRMVAGMLVVVIMGHGRRGSYGQCQRCGRHKGFRGGHGDLLG